VLRIFDGKASRGQNKAGVRSKLRKRSRAGYLTLAVRNLKRQRKRWCDTLLNEQGAIKSKK
jgi:hypothetical protein